MTRQEAFQFGLEVLKPYITRGDKYDDMRASYFGCSASCEPSFQVGGYAMNKQYPNKKAVITSAEKTEVFVFDLKEFYDYYLSPQKKLL